MDDKILMLTGSTRSGTTLISRSVAANSQATCLQQPYMGFFRSYRNAVYAAHDLTLTSSDEPFTDHFLQDPELVKMFLSSDLDMKLIEPMSQLKERLANLNYPGSAEQLIPKLQTLDNVDSYRKLFLELLKISRSVYGNSKTKVDGYIQTWVEFFVGPLLNTFSNARCVHIIRDPRAVISSSSKAFHTHTYPLLMVLRHWRKSVAFASLLKKKFPERVMVLKYEDFITDTENSINNICKLCEIDFDKSSLDISNFKGDRGDSFEANTSYGEIASGFDSSFIDHYKKRLSEKQIAFIEMLCAPEMDRWGYDRISKQYDIDAILNMTGIGHEYESYKSDKWINDYCSDYHINPQNMMQEVGRWLLYNQRDSYTANNVLHNSLERIFLDPSLFYGDRVR